jgi:cardiolipin synthase
VGRRKGGSAGRLTAGAIRVGNTVGAAITSRLVLGAAEAKIMLFGGAVLLSLAVLALVQPLLMVVPFSMIAGWIGVSLLMKAHHLRRTGSNGAVSRKTEDKVMDKVVEIPVLSREQVNEQPREPDSESADESLRTPAAAKRRDVAGS